MRARISSDRLSLIFIYGLLPILSISAAEGIVNAEEPSESIRLIVVSDTHVRLENKDPENMYPSDQHANDRNRFVVDQINQLAPDLVIHLGDICHSIPALPTHEQVVRNSREIYGEVVGELHAAPGNHDIGDKPNAFAASPIVTEDTHKMFLQYWGPTYQSFDRGNVHFVLLNTPVLNSGLPIEGEQKKWLEADLERSHREGKRIFFFTHFPPFLTSPDEEEHYDNLGQPARSWLLSLLEKFEVEAWFCGHSHNVFYNRYEKTHIYVLPSTVFVRPDFSEMFYIEPENEYGRFDRHKLGFMLVHIDPDGHRIQHVPTYGATEVDDDRPVAVPLSLTPGHHELSAAPVGVSLRHSWARPVAKPFDSLDEFRRKLVRNDYVLKGLWDLNIRKLRVPLGDVADEVTLDRMWAFKDRGHEFTVFTVGVPREVQKQLVLANPDVIGSWEVIVPRARIPETIQQLGGLADSSGVAIYISVIDVLGDQTERKDFVFSHFPRHGFLLDETELIESCLTEYGGDEVVDGFVFRLDSNAEIWEKVEQVKKLADRLGFKAVVHLRMPRRAEGIAFTDDRQIANTVAEAILAATAAKEVELFLDTLVDQDRGYYPRNGLMDRRYNPRLAYHVFRHLHHAIGNYQGTFTTSRIGDPSKDRVFSIRTDSYECLLLLSASQGIKATLDGSMQKRLIERGFSYLELHTGRLKRAEPKADAALTSLNLEKTPLLIMIPTETQ